MYISEKQQKFTQNNDRFAFLDGFRGTLALVWVLHHISVILEFPMLDVFSTIAQRYAITGFFLLTSFLLTYRLLKEFHQKPNSNIFITTVQFSIRRFFRVYVVVVIFAFVYSYKKEYRTAVNIITLGNPGANILWTIASGIKYYFVLILICILFHCSQKNVRLYLVLTGLIWTVFDQFFNLLDISWEKNLIYTSPESHFLKSHFAVFFIGSQLAMALVLAESNESFMKFIKEEKNQLFLNVFSIVFGVYSFIFETNLVSYTEDYK